MAFWKLIIIWSTVTTLSFPGNTAALRKDPRCKPVSSVRPADGRCTSPFNFDFCRAQTPTYSYFLTRSISSSSLRDKARSSRLPSTRFISNVLCSQRRPHPSARKLSAVATFFGQFLDHDLFFTPESDVRDDIPVPPHDPFFRVRSSLPFRRSLTAAPPKLPGVQRPLNNAAAAIDLSVVYGHTLERAHLLRSFKNGFLKHSNHDLLSLYSAEYALVAPNAPSSQTPDHFFSGDPRVNEHPVLVLLHTLFSREHNRLAKEAKHLFPNWSDERLFQTARTINIAQMQHIVWNEFLPAMLGSKLPSYPGFSSVTDPSPSDLLSTAALRLGHSMVRNSVLSQSIHQSKPTRQPLQNVFFRNSSFFNEQGGVEAFLKPLFTSISEEIDPFVVNGLRNGLFSGRAGQTVLDLAATNMQRGRDHNLPTYNQVRYKFGYKKVKTFKQLTDDATVRKRLERVYGNIDRVELWPGMLSERKIKSCGSLGLVSCTIWKSDFSRLRNGDFYFYQRNDSWDPIVLNSVPRAKSVFHGSFQGLRQIILRNSKLSSKDVPQDIWKVHR